MQLQIHLGLVSKAEDVKSLVWFIPSLCVVPHLHNTAPWDPCTTGLLMLLQHYSSYKNYFSANTTGSLPWEDFLCLLISSLRCQSSLCISFNVILALDPSHFGALISAGFALDSPSFYIDRGNPESICSLPLPHGGKSLVTAYCSEFFAQKQAVTLELAYPFHQSQAPGNMDRYGAHLATNKHKYQQPQNLPYKTLTADSGSDCTITVTVSTG